MVEVAECALLVAYGLNVLPVRKDAAAPLVVAVAAELAQGAGLHAAKVAGHVAVQEVAGFGHIVIHKAVFVGVSRGAKPVVATAEREKATRIRTVHHAELACRIAP